MHSWCTDPIYSVSDASGFDSVSADTNSIPGYIQYAGISQPEEEENGSHVFVIRVNLMFINEINDNK